MPRAATLWRRILLESLTAQSVVAVALVVSRELGRKPVRSEMTSARRAASRLAQSGEAQVLHATGDAAEMCCSSLALMPT